MFTANSNGGRTLADPSVKFLSFSCSFWGNFGQIVICGPQSWINHYITFVFISFTFSMIKNLKNLKILEIVLYTASKFTDLQKIYLIKSGSIGHSGYIPSEFFWTQETEGQVLCINNNTMTVWILLTKQNHSRKSKFHVLVNQPISQCYHVCVHAQVSTGSAEPKNTESSPQYLFCAYTVCKWQPSWPPFVDWPQQLRYPIECRRTYTLQLILFRYKRHHTPIFIHFPTFAW